MDNPRFPPASPTIKEKNAAQREATALLDILAPEPAVRRGEPQRSRIERHRTPSGCVLQAASAALSVSWFADSSDEPALGELRVVLWRGTVTRRGAPPVRDPAEVAGELTVTPVQNPADDHVWQSTSGDLYTTAELASRCSVMLEDQIEAG